MLLEPHIVLVLESIHHFRFGLLFPLFLQESCSDSIVSLKLDTGACVLRFTVQRGYFS
jgi:hypothetical protein